MKKVSIIYWSGTGNTEQMAHAVAAGAQTEQTEVSLLPVSKAKAKHVTEADYIAFGCPSMGDEVLEENEMEPFIRYIETMINGKPLVLFGSYGWGSGQWMEEWTQRMKGKGAKLMADGLIINNEPDDEGLSQCRDLGLQLIK